MENSLFENENGNFAKPMLAPVRVLNLYAGIGGNRKYWENVEVTAIEYNEEIANVCETLARRGVRVIVAGLDMDYLGKPFGQMPNLLAIADYITKLHAICVQCGNIANISYRKAAGDEQVLLGEKDVYEPRCRVCYHKK